MSGEKKKQNSHEPSPQDEFDILAGDVLHGANSRRNQIPCGVAAVVPEAAGTGGCHFFMQIAAHCERAN